MTQITKEAIEAAEREFTEYFVRNYPGPDTIIFDPKWHAPKLFRAATHSLLSTLPIAGEGKGEALDTYDAGLLNDWGGGDVSWWQNYIRDELGRAHEFYAAQFATAPISPDELLSLIPDEIDIPPMTDRGVAGQVLDVAWPLCGGNHQDADFWNIFSFAVHLTLRVSSPGKDGGQEVEAAGYRWTGSLGEDRLKDPNEWSISTRKPTHIPEGWKLEPLYTRPQPASTALVERGNLACPCTTFQQDEDCEVGYPSLLCTACDGKGITTVDKVVALAAEMMKVAEQVDELEDPFAAWETIDLLKSQNEQFRKLAAPSPHSTVDADAVINLVVAAREFWDANNDLSDESRALDNALEAFSSLVPYENEPHDAAFSVTPAKALEWRLNEEGWQIADTFFGGYRVERNPHDHWCWGVFFHGEKGVGLNPADNFEAAKAAAQADFNERISSALDAKQAPDFRDMIIIGDTAYPVHSEVCRAFNELSAALSVRPAAAVVGEPVAWTTQAQIDKFKVDPGCNAVMWGEPLPHHPDIPLYAAPSAPEGVADE